MKTINELIEFGIINIDKPNNMTSFQVSDYVRNRLKARKTSHMGTLDPGVSGVLPITINRACRLSRYLMKKNKTYIGIMRAHKILNLEDLKEEVKNFVGKIKQIPPVRSSVKRIERERVVMKFDILEMNEKNALFYAEVEAGTYIRTLIHDLGKKIGGAHMLELRRISAGTFNEKNSINLYDFDKAIEAYDEGNEMLLREIIIPAERIVKMIAQILEIKKNSLKKILSGKPIHINDIVKKDIKKTIKKESVIGIFCNDRFVEMARVVLRGEIIAVPEFVFN